MSHSHNDTKPITVTTLTEYFNCAASLNHSSHQHDKKSESFKARGTRIHEETDTLIKESERAYLGSKSGLQEDGSFQINIHSARF